MLLRIVLSLSPLLLLAFRPLTSHIFLGDIRPWLFPLAVAGVLYLQAVRLSRRAATSSIPALGKAQAVWRRFLDAPPQKTAFRLFLIALAVYSLLLSGAVAPVQPFTGDEPHYLLIAKSMARDGDLNLYQDYEEEAYREFYPGPLDSHASPGKKGPDHIYSRHFPGISLIVAPFYALGRLTGNPRALIAIARFPIALLSALLAALFFLFVLDLVRDRSIALLGWGLFALTTPLIFYSQVIYSEVPVSLITLFILRKVVLNKDLSALSLGLAGAGIGLLPWFGIKYLVLAAVVFLAAIASIWTCSSRRMKDAVIFAAPAAVLMLLLAAGLWSLYGSVSPAAVYHGSLAGQGVLRIRLFKTQGLEFWNHLLGIFIDQRMGILMFNPVLLLFLPGIVLAARKRRAETLLLLTPFFLWTIFESAVRPWGGYCPPGRPLLPVQGVMAGFAAVALARRDGKTRRILGGALIAATVLITLVCLRNPMLMYHANLSEEGGPSGTYSQILSSAKILFFDATPFVPALSNRTGRIWLPVPFWLVGLGFATWLWLRRGRRPARGPRPLFVHAAGAFLLSLFVLAFSFFRAGLDADRSFEIPGGRVFFQDDNTQGPELGGFWTKGQSRAAVIVRTPAPATEISVEVSSAVSGSVEVEVGPTRKTVRLEEGKLKAAPESQPPVGFPWRGGYLYKVRILAGRTFIPHELNPASSDGRTLGVFVRISVVR